MEEILEQARASGFVPTLAGKPIEPKAKPAKKRSKKSALSKDDSIGAIKRAALRSFAPSQQLEQLRQNDSSVLRRLLMSSAGPTRSR